MEKYTAIVLAGGSGKRMGLSVKKQYIEICNKPLLYYSVHAFEKSDVDEIVLVVTPGDENYVKEEIVEKYGFKKVSAIVPGGKERYNSVYEGLKVTRGDYVLIHDGARAFVTKEIIRRSMDGAKEYGACVVGMPVKDTIKVADDDGYVKDTPERSSLWMVQTPQAFFYPLVKDAYEKVLEKDATGVTDDAMVVELATDQKVKLIEGSYDNIKVTTIDDLDVAENILKKQNHC
ncbi:MAG: 2-C-methyl-D-erythritol 4-phosphate cytidylyltransferase [Lachnospiraceae bacterium]|nr:2-C-methyl-D-erythritol 4-phosphate cytidylyltransferase [Lachnospiraceae bacterium]